MKLKIQATAKKWDCRFNITKSILFLILCLISSSSIAQEIEYYKKSIKVNPDTRVEMNAPTSLDFSINGRISTTNNTRFSYIIRGKEDVQRISIHKDIEIKTWDKNEVLQEVEIHALGTNSKVTEELLEALNIDLKLGPDNRVFVDCNMNMEKFTMSNSFFSGDDCKLILANGKKYPIESLRIKTSLSIPKTINLKINSILNNTVRLGDFEGDLELDLYYGEVYGKKIKNLDANLRFCYNVIFEEADFVKVSGTNSHLKVNKVNKVEIGEKRLSREPSFLDFTGDFTENNSSMNIYNFGEVGEMIIYDTANDEFKIGTVDKLIAKSSVFSNYQVLRLNDELSFNAKNSDLNISEVNDAFESIVLDNTLSTINLNMADDSNYKINITGKEYLEYTLPKNNVLLEQKQGMHSIFKVGEGEGNGEVHIRCDNCNVKIW